MRWSQICACGCYWYEKYFSVNSLLVMSPWLTGCARPRVGFSSDQGNSLLFGSHCIEGNLLLKNCTNPILCFPLSLSISYSDSLLSFALVVWKILHSHSHTHTPTSIYFRPFLRSFFGTRKLTWVGDAFTNLMVRFHISLTLLHILKI